MARLTHTYSIVARDKITGEMGVAVQSHWFSVGSVVAWAEAGVGAVATQSLVNPSFGPNGLEMLKQGTNAKETVMALIEGDPGREHRQLGIVDAKGNSFAFTGAKCVAEAGHRIGKGYTVQANMMLSDRVWSEMSEAFESSDGDLAQRLLLALQAAESVGGDIRGRQSSCILVVRGEPTGMIWKDRTIDLRVEDSPDPLGELERLLRVHRAYGHMDKGDEAIEKGDMVEANRQYSEAERMFPENEEMAYWHAVTLANVGHIEDAIPIFAGLFQRDGRWREMTVRLVPAGLLKVTSSDLERILRK